MTTSGWDMMGSKAVPPGTTLVRLCRRSDSGEVGFRLLYGHLSLEELRRHPDVADMVRKAGGAPDEFFLSVFFDGS